MPDFMTSEYDTFDDVAYGTGFQKTKFLANIANKIGRALNLDDETIGRVDAELAYPHFSLCRGAGPQMTMQNERAFSLVPYSEPIFTFSSARVPLDYKNLGRFEAELIRLADPGLASYQSAYGFSFTDGPTLKARLVQKAKQLTPIAVRPLLHRQKARLKQSRELPFYLEQEYLREIFPDGFPNIKPFVNIGKITDHKILSRAYTVELILSGKYCGTGSS